MNAVIHPGLLRGGVRVPPSKSVAHRVLIAAALADAPTEIEISAERGNSGDDRLPARAGRGDRAHGRGTARVSDSENELRGICGRG